MFNSHRDDRRRRALAEDWAGETVTAAPAASAAAKSSGKQDRYTAAARRENHRRISDFVSRSAMAHVLWWLAGLTVVAGLLAGFATLVETDELSATSAAAPLFQLSHGGSLIGWVSSMLFLWAAGGSVLIYTIRRHRLDDYRGSYRLWLWSTAAWLVMSIDATANLHTPFSHAMAAATGWSMAGNSAVWWIGVWGLLLLVLAIRLTIETRQCRAAMIGIVFVFSLWAAAMAIDCHWISGGEHATLIAAGGRLIGQVTLLLSIGLFARHVLLDAEGLLPEKAAKPKREKPRKKAASNRDDDEEKSGTSTKYDSAHKTADKRTDLQPHTTVAQPANRGPLSSRVASVSASHSNSSSISPNRSRDDDDEEEPSSSNRHRDYDDDDEDASGGGNRKLSRAERKRLRKLQRQQERDDR